MHCKNFSLIEKDDRGYQLSPAYDLLAVQLTGINDKDELAMPLVGYGVDDNETLSGFNRSSLVQAMVASGIAEGVAVRIIDKMISRTGKWDDVIDSSFLKDELKSNYKSLVAERKNRIVK